MRITSPDQEIACTACGARMSGHVERREVPYSEVAMHMRIAGDEMWMMRVGPHMVQLYDDDGRVFSSPITSGEAGWRR